MPVRPDVCQPIYNNKLWHLPIIYAILLEATILATAQANMVHFCYKTVLYKV